MALECPGTFCCIQKGFVCRIVALIKQCRFRHQHIRSAFKPVTQFYKVGTQKTLGPVTVYRIAQLLTGNEPYLIAVCFLIEKYEVGSMPGFVGTLVDAVERFAGLYACKMLDLGDGIIPPVSFCLLLFLQRSLFCRSLSSFLF